MCGQAQLGRVQQPAAGGDAAALLHCLGHPESAPWRSGLRPGMCRDPTQARMQQVCPLGMQSRRFPKPYTLSRGAHERGVPKSRIWVMATRVIVLSRFLRLACKRTLLHHPPASQLAGGTEQGPRRHGKAVLRRAPQGPQQGARLEQRVAKGGVEQAGEALEGEARVVGERHGQRPVGGGRADALHGLLRGVQGGVQGLQVARVGHGAGVAGDEGHDGGVVHAVAAKP